MCGCECLTAKKAEHQRIDAFELWCWRRVLRVPWTAMRSNQSIVTEISPGISLESDAKAETPVLWPPHAKGWLIGKDSDSGRDSGQEEKLTTEDEMAGWHHWLDGHESEWTPGVADRQGGLMGCDSWGRKESDTTERVNWSETYLPRLGRSPGGSNVSPLQYSCLENSMDRADWWTQLMGTQRVGHDWVTQHSLAQTCLKVVIPYELHHFKSPNRRKEKKKSKSSCWKWTLNIK